MTKKRTVKNRIAVSLLVGVITGLAILALMAGVLLFIWLMVNVSPFIWMPLLAGLAVAFIYFVDSDEYV